MSFDLLIQNAHVIDLAQNWDGSAEVGISGGKVVAFSPRLDPTGCPDVHDARGLYLCPGLIDLHGHWYEAGLFGINAEIGLNHGVTTGALFLLVGYLYERRHSLEISAYGGVATPAPNLASVFLITTLASIGLPMLNNFIGEYLVLQGASFVSFTATVFAAVGVILSACYMLWHYRIC